MAAKPAPAVSVPKPATQVTPTPKTRVYQLGEGSEPDYPQGAALPPTQIAEEKDSEQDAQEE